MQVHVGAGMQVPLGETAVEETLTNGVLTGTLPKKSDREDPGGVPDDVEQSGAGAVRDHPIRSPDTFPAR